MYHRSLPTHSQVICPKWGKEPLAFRSTCTQIWLCCHGCRRLYDLSELAVLLDERDFDEISEALNDRFSDRI